MDLPTDFLERARRLYPPAHYEKLLAAFATDDEDRVRRLLWFLRDRKQPPAVTLGRMRLAEEYLHLRFGAGAFDVKKRQWAAKWPRKNPSRR